MNIKQYIYIFLQCAQREQVRLPAADEGDQADRGQPPDRRVLCGHSTSLQSVFASSSVVTNIWIRIRIRIFSTESRIFGFGFMIFFKANNIWIRIPNRILTFESESF